MRTLYYGLAVAGFLVLVAITALLTNEHADGLGVLLLALLWLAAPLASLVFLIWFIVTLNSIARSLREQTHIARHTAGQLDLLAAREGADATP
ncbi:hypothetical protein [Saccharothrix syringae]|uniref:Uncharacterized protein n=1 Tax=Saccharothrix syringae TaxID=103733 RepID=A0A5Q0H3J1_SACSY|nr:hypothetical protein [Saccharothrix syringae]QFZ20444.1 hypothetical protein EKG83_26210 [Saccharothrix syringae]